MSLVPIDSSGNRSETITRTTWYNIVNDRESIFGNRWTMAVLDQLHPVDGVGALLVTGQGQSLWFDENNGIYTAPEGNATGVRLVAENGGFTLTTKDGDYSLFDSTGRLTHRGDALGNDTVFDYDAQLRLSTITDPSGQVVTFSYTVPHQISTTDSAGRTTKLNFDAADELLLSVEQPSPSGTGTGPTTSFAYDPTTNLLLEETDAAGNVTRYQYNEALRLKRIVNPDGSHVVLDAADTHYMVANFPGLGGNVTHAFPLADARVPVAGPNGSSLGAPGSWTDEAGRISQFTVDRFGNLTSWTDPLGSTSMWLRDELGLVTQTVSPGANDSTTALSTFYYYGGGGAPATDLTSVVYPDNSSESWTYDSESNRVASHTDQAGRVTTYAIDSTTHLVTSMTRGGDPAAGSDDVAALLATTSYTYTTADDGVPAGLVETVTDPLGRVTHFEYYDDSVQSGKVAGLLKTITYAVGTPDEATRHFAYNNARELISSTDELGRETDFLRDDLGRVTATTLDAVHAGPTTTYQYNALNDVVAVTDALGRTTAYRYDSRNNVERAIMPAPGQGQGLVAPEIVYGYNADRSKATVIDVLGHVTRTDYDGDGRVATVTAPDPDGPGTDHPLTSPVTHYLYYADSRLKSVEDANGNFVTYAYDTSGFGRLMTITAPDPTGATTYTVTHMGYNVSVR